MENEKKAFENISEGIKKQLGEDVAVSVSIRRKIAKTPDFVMIYQEIGKKVLEGTISLSTSKVFFYLVMNIDFENFIGIDLKSISENIKMPLPTVKKTMRELKEIGILISIKDNFDTRRNIYRLNPVVAWKGKVNNRTKAIKENPNQVKMFPDEDATKELI
jgi:DNA-binding MarR family transcriptional regulator